MNITEWLELILLGGVAGALGQCIRAVVGLKKLNDTINAQQAQTIAGERQPGIGDVFDTARFMISLLIGFTAGALAAIAFGQSPDVAKSIQNLDPKTLLAFLAAGYTGTDFIEGFMNRYLPGGGTQQNVALRLRHDEG